MWFSESFWRNLWFFVPRRFPVSSISLTPFVLDRITDFVLWSDPVWSHLCDLIFLISSFWSDLIFSSSILSSVRSFHKFSWVFLYSGKSVVWKNLMELPLVRPLLVPVFFFRLPFLMWTNFVSSALDFIVLHFDTLSVNFLLFCVSGMDN